MSRIEYKCPYCDIKLDKRDLLNHVSDKHDDLIPENFSVFHSLYDYFHMNKIHKCDICGKPTEWNEFKGKYNVICSNKVCKKKFEENTRNPQFKTPKGQEELLSKRKISGVYKFSDGVEKTYTGSYEKNCLEFMDKVLHVQSEDILAPGVTLEYEYEGSKHMYLSDFYYAPYNLIIEVKDGGNNPNRKSMIEYRKKVVAKEKYIIDKTNYNYIRLTDNDFTQLMTIFFELKMKYLNDSPERIVRINE